MHRSVKRLHRAILALIKREPVFLLPQLLALTETSWLMLSKMSKMSVVSISAILKESISILNPSATIDDREKTSCLLYMYRREKARGTMPSTGLGCKLHNLQSDI